MIILIHVLQRASRYLRSSASSRYGSVSEDDGYFNQNDEEVFVNQRVSLTPSSRLTPSHFRMSPMALPVKEFQFLSQPLSRNNSKTNQLQKKVKTCSLLSVDHLN